MPFRNGQHVLIKCGNCKNRMGTDHTSFDKLRDKRKLELRKKNTMAILNVNVLLSFQCFLSCIVPLESRNQFNIIMHIKVEALLATPAVIKLLSDIQNNTILYNQSVV